MNSVIDHSVHSLYSEPGRHTGLLAGLPTDPDELSSVARNVIVHYRASGRELPVEHRDDINARWLADILDLDQNRHPMPLAQDRPITQRVQGCCRDHTLFCVGALRSNGVPARSRLGFAGYFVEGWHHDHVIVEAWLDGRWHRFDPEIGGPLPSLPTPMDIEFCDVSSQGFVTAARVWDSYRTGNLDPETYGVDPDVPVLRGERFLFDEVIHEVAHRFGHELLLWDCWGRMGEPGDPVSNEDALWADDVARLLLASDQGDERAEQELFGLFQSDDGLLPGSTAVQASPYGDPPVAVQLLKDANSPVS